MVWCAVEGILDLWNIACFLKAPIASMFWTCIFIHIADAQAALMLISLYTEKRWLCFPTANVQMLKYYLYGGRREVERN